MRKMLSVLTAAAFITAALAGCSASKTSESATTAPETTTAAEATAEQTTTDGTAKTMQADIVVIGAGGAGMTAAIQAVQDGATNVVILEKMPIVGGNTTRSTGGLNAADTQYQEEEGIEDSVDLFVEDTMKGGKELNNEDLVRFMAENSADAVDWVNEIGGDLSVVGMFGGASVKRIHRPTDTSAVGPMLVKALSAKVEELNIPVLLETTATQIMLDGDGKVASVKAKDKDGSELTINCAAVVLATGGFGANNEMVISYQPGLAGFGTTNQSGATGDGIRMAEEIGAALVDMDQIQTHPTVHPDTQTMYTEGVRGNGAILVNLDGKRFVNELETRDVVSAAILEQPEGYCYMIFDQDVRESLSAIESYIKKGIVTEADTIEELAEMIDINPEALADTMRTYAEYQQSGTDEEFGRADMALPLTASKFYAAVCAPAIHHTMGGVKIDTTTAVLKEDNTAIPGLFAAGEVTGGVHGANRLGGNAVTDIVVFGRQAGTAAENYVMDTTGNTESTIKMAGEEEVLPETEGGFKDGTYTGTGKGNNGDIMVEVTVKDGNITAVTLKEHSETAGIYESAEKGVVAEIIRKQTADVDAVAGATNTSKGIMEAVKNAIKDAK